MYFKTIFKTSSNTLGILTNH